MLFPMPFFVGVLCGVAGLLLAGWIAALYAEWFHLSSFEGASGYMIVAVALLGGAAAFGIGVVCGWRAGAFGKGSGFGLGIVAGLSFLAWGFARLTGDVPPTWDGGKLAVVAELRAPQGWSPSNRARFHGVTTQLLRMEGGVERYYFQGHTDWEDARLADGRWTIPGHAEVFTRKGRRKLRFVADRDTLAEFDLALPARPGKEFAQWSSWQPESGFQFRFCLRKANEVLAAENGKYERIESEWKQRVAAMKPGAPLSEWTPLVYTGNQRSPDSGVLVRVLEVIRARPAELAPLLVSKDPHMARCALQAVGQLQTIPPELLPAMRTAAANLADDLRAYATTFDARDPDLSGAVELKLRFSDWAQAWRDTGKPFPPELSSIGTQAASVPEGTEIDGLKAMAAEYQKN